MLHKVRPCPDCGSEMNYRLGEYICSACEYTEPGFAQLLEEEVELLEVPEAAQPQLAEEDASNASPGLFPDAGYLVPPPPLTVDGRLAQPALAKVSAGITAARSMKLRGEKFACLAAYAALLIYGAVSSYLTLPQVMQQFYAGLQQDVDESLALIPSIDLSGHAGAVALVAGIYILLQLGITWWILFRAAAWIKWCSIGCAVLTVLGSLSATPWLVLGALPGISRAQMLLAEVLQLAWQGWVASLLYRDLRLHQRE
jgi:hypothetical protein